MKLAFRLILAAVLGLATTLALAWVPPMLEPTLGQPKDWSNAQLWIDETHAGHYQVRRARFADAVRMLHILFSGAPSEQPFYKTEPPPRWCFKLLHSTQGEGAASGSPWWGVDTLATGWPFRAFRGGIYQPWPTTPPTFSTVPSKPVPSGPVTVAMVSFGGKAPADRFTIPFRPIPIGLTLNTLIFSLAWLALFATFIQFRSWRRARRGCCRACNYDLRGLAPCSPCPECGRHAR